MPSLPAFLLIAMVAALGAPAVPGDRVKLPHPRVTSKSTTAHLSLYSPRVRRSSAAYLRLRLLELHEIGLDRARAAIERRLSVDELIGGPDHGELHLPAGPPQQQRTAYPSAVPW